MHDFFPPTNRNRVQFERREQTAPKGTPGHPYTAPRRQGKTKPGI